MTRPAVLLYLILLGLAPAAAQVDYEQLRKADPANWLSYSGSYNSQRHSLLKQIHSGNVRDLVPTWIYQMPGSARLESVPVVVDGVMYLSQPNEVHALDARTGRLIWRYRHEPALGKGPNRGVAVYGSKVFFTTPDAFLVALDARAGNFLWQSKIAEAKEGYWSPAAPLVLNGKIIAGVAPGDYGMNGFLDAYDISTGERLRPDAIRR
jgi:alcohol dehydrogenase (cytochrome c)